VGWRGLNAEPASADRNPLPPLAGFDERVQVRAIDEDASQRLALTVALAWTKRRQIDDGDSPGGRCLRAVEKRNPGTRLPGA
jgi:hypothetical protein